MPDDNIIYGRRGFRQRNEDDEAEQLLRDLERDGAATHDRPSDEEDGGPYYGPSHDRPQFKPFEVTDFKKPPKAPQVDVAESSDVDGVQVVAPTDSQTVSRKPKPNYETDDIKSLLAKFEEAQKKDAGKKDHSRAQAYAINAGEVMRAGLQGETPNYTPIPNKRVHSDSADAEKYARLKNDLMSGEEKRQNPEQERELKDKLFESRVQAEVAKQLRDQGFKVADREDKQGHDSEEKNKDRGVKISEGDKNRKAGIVGPILKATITNGSQGSRADSEYANRQAERQLGGGWESTGPHSQTDETKGAHLAGAEASVQKIGRETVAGMRKNGRNFPMSTEWRKLESSMSVLHEDLNKLHEEGVMNFGDKGNRIVESGDPQSFNQWVLDMGPDILEHALDNISKTTDARMAPLKYKRNPNAKMKMPSEYLDQSSGGGTHSSPLQDPNVVPGIVDFVNNGGQMPNLKAPNGGGSGPKKAHWDPNLRKMVDENGQPVVR